MDRRTFLLGAGITGLAACAKPERDLLAPYEGVDIVLQPGNRASAIVDSTSTSAPALSPMESLRLTVPAEDRAGLSFVARARDDVVTVEAAPGDGTALWTFTNPIESGGQLVFLVDDYDGLSYYRVLLPTRPNGSFGWIRADAVDLAFHNFAIRVELDEFRLTVFDHDEVVMNASCGIARENAPTPLGQYYTTEIIKPLVADSVYGAFAYGLSGYSETFTSFNGGPGQLGIHGTSDPDSIGTNVSSGCIRLHNDDVTAMVEDLKVTAGVPVEVI